MLEKINPSDEKLKISIGLDNLKQCRQGTKKIHLVKLLSSCKRASLLQSLGKYCSYPNN